MTKQQIERILSLCAGLALALSIPDSYASAQPPLESPSGRIRLACS